MGHGRSLNKVPARSLDINNILRGAHREIGEMLRVAHGQQFVVTATRGHHFKVSTPPGTAQPMSAFAPKTPSDTRGLHRVRAKLRRIGVEFARS